MSGENDKLDLEYLTEMARILGTDVITKEASRKTPDGAPGADKMMMAMKKFPPKGRGHSKLASMSLREIMGDENFRRGVFEEIEAARPLLETLVAARAQRE
jgi:hypothetical protein